MSEILQPLDPFYRFATTKELWTAYPEFWIAVAVITLLLGLIAAYLAARKVRTHRDECLAEFERLNRELSETEARTVDLRKHLADSSQKRELETVTARFESDLKKRQSAIESLNEQIGDLRLGIDDREGQIVKFRKRDEERLSEFNEIKLSLGSRESEIDSLRTEVEGSRQELSAREKAIADRENELTGLRARLDELEEDRGRVDGEMNDLRSRAEQAESAAQEKERAATELRDRLGEFEGLLSERAAEINELRLRLQNSEGAGVEVEGLRSKVGELEGLLSERAGEFDGLRLQYQEEEGSYKSRIQDLEGSSQTRIQELEAGYQTRIQELEDSYRSRTEDLEASSQSRIDELEGSVREWKERFETSEANLAKSGNQLDADAQVRITDLEYQLGTVGQDNNALRDEIDRLEVLLGERASEIEEARNSYLGKEDEALALTARFAELEKNTGSSQKELEELRLRLANAESNLAEAESRAGEGGEATENLRIQLEDTRSVLAEREKELATLRSRAEKNEQSVGSAEQEIVELRATLEGRNEEITLERDRFHSVEGDLNDLQSRITQLEVELDDRGTRLKSLEREHSNLQLTYKSKQEDFLSLKALLGELKSREAQASAAVSSLAAADTTANRLEDRILGLERSLASRDKAIAQLKATPKPKAAARPKPVKKAVKKTAPKPKPKTKKKAPAKAKSIPGTRKDAKMGAVYRKRPSSIDDLKLISGVAKVLEGKLHKFGVYRFQQIAEWKKPQIDEFDKLLSFKDRIRRDKWVAQAKKLHAEKYGK